MTNTVTADLLVCGETAAGVAAAVRAAREGLSVILTCYQNTLGGVLPSLGAVETHYTGARSPFVEEFKRRVVDFYRDTYGEDSEPYQTCIRLDPDIPMITFEPKVAARILREIVEAEPRIQVLRRCWPVSVELAHERLLAVTVAFFETDERQRIEAAAFIDATDEGDLAALAGVPYRIGRESRHEYDEPHAGKLFTRYVPGLYPIDAAEGRLNILPKWSTLGIYNGSTGVGDDNIQDYSYRLCLSCDPHNRILPEKPEGYDREAYLPIAQTPAEIGTRPYPLQHRFLNYSPQEMIAIDHIIHGHALPNNKRSWNATNFTGAGKGYAHASWPERSAIARRHLNHALSILYFMQNDAAMPEDIRQQARQWGLAKDEFVENGNIPEHLYVREARRIRGRYTFTENDNGLAPCLERAPIHRDSIAITEFPNDSLPCTTERRPGTLPDGQTFLMESSRPGQVPYRVILPERFENLLVPLCASVTHVAWGTIRQTPTQIQIAEAAACAAALAHRQGIAPGQLPIEQLQRHLLKIGSMLTFFNEFDMQTDAPWVAAVQYLGTKSFFASYDARPTEPLSQITAERWVNIAGLVLGTVSYDASAAALLLPSDAADRASPAIRPTAFIADLKQRVPRAATAALPEELAGAETLSRGAACQIIDALLLQAGL